MTDLETERTLRLTLAGALVVLVANGAINLALDAPLHGTTLHVVFELFSIAVALAAAVVLWIGWWRAARTVRAVRSSLEERNAERDTWRENARRALEGLGEAIDAQFRGWGLTPTEREVALLLLKGHSHKRIAEMTGRRERTVRQHAVVIYQKAGIRGRAELAAFFLDDLLLPEHERDHVKAG